MTRILNTLDHSGQPGPITPIWLTIFGLVLALVLGILIAFAPMLVSMALLGILSLVLELCFPGILVFLLMVGYAWKDDSLSSLIRDFSGLPISPSEIVLIVTISACLVNLAVGRRWKLPARIPGLKAIGLLAAWAMLAAVQGINYSLVETARAAVPVYYALFYFITIFFIRSWEQFKIALICFVGGLVISLVFGFLPLPRAFWFLTPGAAGYVLIPIFLFLSVPAAIFSKRSRWFLLPCWGIGLSQIFLTDSRSTLVALVLTVLLFVLLNGRLRKLRWAHLKFFGVGVVVSLILGSAVYVFMPEKTARFAQLTATIALNSSNSVTAGKVRTASVRLLLWQAVMAEANQHPFYGIGLGTPWPGFALVDNPQSWWGSSGTENMSRLPYANPHNTYIHLLLRMGWIGMLLYVLVWGQILWTIHRQSLRINQPQVRLAVHVLWMSSLYLLIFTFFQPYIESPHIGLMPWVFTGTAAALINLSTRLDRPVAMQVQAEF